MHGNSVLNEQLPTGEISKCPINGQKKKKSISRTPPVWEVAVELMEKDVFQESLNYGLFCKLAEKQ